MDQGFHFSVFSSSYPALFVCGVHNSCNRYRTGCLSGLGIWLCNSRILCDHNPQRPIPFVLAYGSCASGFDSGALASRADVSSTHRGQTWRTLGALFKTTALHTVQGHFAHPGQKCQTSSPGSPLLRYSIWCSKQCATSPTL